MMRVLTALRRVIAYTIVFVCLIVLAAAVGVILVAAWLADDDYMLSEFKRAFNA